MSREFKLVLLGAGLLSAGFFLLPSDDAAARAADDPNGGGGGGGGGNGSSVRRGYAPIFFVTSYSRSSTAMARTGSSPTVSRGGFGSSGFRFSGG